MLGSLVVSGCKKTFLANYTITYRTVHKLQSIIAKEKISKFVDKKLSATTKELVLKHQKKFMYNTILYSGKTNLVAYRDTADNNVIVHKQHNVLPLSLKYIDCDDKPNNEEITENVSKAQEHIHFPFKDKIEIEEPKDTIKASSETEDANSSFIEIQERAMNYDKTDLLNWMNDYECYDDRNQSDGFDWKVSYGTPDETLAVSMIPCGGCGALLHCRDTSLPGYLPSEIYKPALKGTMQLKELICQRCHFLRHYNTALKVQVGPEDYLKVLSSISKQNAIVILMVDLLDFPCSIWPGIADLLPGKPIVVVANKVDLLPQDGYKFLDRIKTVLIENLKLNGFAMARIKDIHLISAKTGFGVENLITGLHNLWKMKSDYYLIGSTNVGKSTLFNILLQSDFCKVENPDLLQRATTSPWPGTTLNLLKFPVLRPSDWRQHERLKRLESMSKFNKAETMFRREQLRNTGNPKYASLIGYVGRTFTERTSEPSGKEQKIGINEKDEFYKFSRWCYDTPGVVHDDQIIHYLTTEEILLTLPKNIIQPRTFCIKPKTSILIAGLARLDYLEGARSVRFTVFCSNELPITICKTDDAQELYDIFLGTEVFLVPSGSKNRLKKWPKLKSASEMKVSGKDLDFACADVVLSNAGWISVTTRYKDELVLKSWTPEAKGIYVRNALIPRAVTLRGRRIRGTPAYAKSKLRVTV